MNLSKHYFLSFCQNRPTNGEQNRKKLDFVALCNNNGQTQIKIHSNRLGTNQPVLPERGYLSYIFYSFYFYIQILGFNVLGFFAYFCDLTHSSLAPELHL